MTQSADMCCLIGLGSNLGDRLAMLRLAVHSLQQLGSVQVSRLYQSPPMGPQDQPPYLNAVAALQTRLQPHDLLDALQAIEQQAGRVRLRRWGERTLDLDLLVYEDQAIQTERLTVPHPGLMERDFVVLPVLDLLPALHVNGVALSSRRSALTVTAQVVAERNWPDDPELHLT